MPARDPYALSSYQFDLPSEQIAQYPRVPRDQSRLMVIERKSGQITEMVFRDIADFLQERDRLIFNDTKVIPARLIGKRPTGGETEIFLTRMRGEGLWEAMVRPGRKLRAGSRVIFSEIFSCEILERLPDGGALVQFHYEGNFDALLDQHGKIPLPQYIRREADPILDKSRYQTVYASQPGALAAPTAGLHFSRELIEKLVKKGVYQTTVTLHVGLGTFRPVQVDDIREHIMHTERVCILPEAAVQLNSHPGDTRQVCVGTTSLRALEAVADAEGLIPSGEFDANIFIYPGYRFKYARTLLTNFHLPGSSLLMLVSAFAGYELTMEAYAKAVRDGYRFFSYGDAMLIL